MFFCGPRDCGGRRNIAALIPLTVRFRSPELWFCVGAAVVLVLLRSVVPVLWETGFNSDQAIVGLMAKHLSEGRAFPLFFYGQNYMLGVQSWIAVPFFWIGGPTIAMLRAPLVVINAGVAAALVVMVARLGVRPALALVAALPLIVTTPIVSEALLETIGASIEPFAYVLLLWGLRRRPLIFGALFCFACLHREFVVFVAPALLAVQWRERAWWQRAEVARAVAGAAAVWLVVDILKRTVNAYGPPGGEHASSSLLLQAQQILMWLSAAPAPYGDRLAQAATWALPDMLGAKPYALSEYGVAGGLRSGWRVAGWALGAATCIALVRVITSRSTAADAPRESFFLYLGVVGALTLLAYGLNSGIDAAAPPVVRYLLFALLMPVAVLGAFFLRERAPVLRGTVAALVCTWAAFTAFDNVRLLKTYAEAPPPNPHREIADYLTEHKMRFGRAGYWDAYLITFLARERVVLASTEKVRISAYQARVEENAANAVFLRRLPCSSGPRIAAWCLEDPFSGSRRRP